MKEQGGHLLGSRSAIPCFVFLKFLNLYTHIFRAQLVWMILKTAKGGRGRPPPQPAGIRQQEGFVFQK